MALNRKDSIERALAPANGTSAKTMHRSEGVSNLKELFDSRRNAGEIQQWIVVCSELQKSGWKPITIEMLIDALNKVDETNDDDTLVIIDRGTKNIVIRALALEKPEKFYTEEKPTTLLRRRA